MAVTCTTGTCASRSASCSLHSCATVSTGGAGRLGTGRAGWSPTVSAPAVQSTAAPSAAASNAAQIFVSAHNGSDAGDGSMARPFATLQRASRAARALRASAPNGAVIWLRGGTFYEQLELTAADSGRSAAAPLTVASYPGERATLSGGVPLDGLSWSAVPGSSPTIYRAALPARAPASFTGLFGAGKRLTRALPQLRRHYRAILLHAQRVGADGGKVRSPTHDLFDEAGAENLEVKNQRGVDMFGDASSDDAPARGPHGASDGTLAAGANLSLTVEHPDYAWRCHEDCGWSAYSKWRGVVCEQPDACRMDATHNEPYWDQQVSSGFHFNATAAATPWAPAWTPRAWANASTGTVHMYHSARWGGWQFRLAARDDEASALRFACRIGGVEGACPLDGNHDGLVLGGWQEARGGNIGPKYTDPRLNNSYFVEGIREELDVPGEWFYDEAARELLLIPPKGVSIAALASTLVATARHTVAALNGSSAAPVRHVRLENVTVAHAEATYMQAYETPSGGDWSIHRGAAVVVSGAEGVAVAGVTFDQADGNGVILSGYVRNASVARNDFISVGDSAIVLLGGSGRHRTNNADNREFPAFNVIEANHIDGVGVWTKQSAAYFKALARENVVRGNVFHDGPRSGVNFNDGAFGGERLEGNLIFNFVRESNDHGARTTPPCAPGTATLTLPCGRCDV